MSVSGTEMLGRIADELGRLAEHGIKLQTTISTALTEPGLTRSLEDLQSLDLITQTLEALAVVVDAVRRTAPADWPVSEQVLSRNVRLHGLCRTLLGDTAMPHPAGVVDIW